MRILRYLGQAYATADPRSLAAGRIALASVLLVDLGRRVAEMGTWYTNDGLLPNHTLLWRPTFRHVFSFFYMASFPHEAALGFVFCAFAYLALLFGLFTRAAQIASLAAVLSLHGRIMFVQNGGDVVLSELALWTAFLPLGRRYSVDAWRLRAPSDPAAVDRPAPDTRPVVSLAFAALVLQLAAIYLFNTIQKTGPTWRQGSALHYVLYQSRIVTAFGVWARDQVPYGALQVLTRAVHGVEGLLALLLLAPLKEPFLRRSAVALVVALHIGFALFLNLGVFVPGMMAYAPFLLSARDWDAIERWARRAPSLLHRAAGALRAFAERIARLTPGRAPPAAGPRWLDARLAREALTGLVMIVAGTQLLAENAAARPLRVYTPSPIAAAVSYLQLFQGWSMFAPDAPTSEMNVYVDAVTADGRHVDPFNEIANPSHPAPGATIPDRLDQDAFLCDYLSRIAGRPEYHQPFIDWILRYPERTGRPADRIASFEAFTVTRDSPLPGERAAGPPRTSSFLRWSR